MLIAGSGRPRVLGPTERQAPIIQGMSLRLGRSPLTSTGNPQLLGVRIHLVGLRRSLASSDYNTLIRCCSASDAKSLIDHFGGGRLRKPDAARRFPVRGVVLGSVVYSLVNLPCSQLRSQGVVRRIR